VSKTKGVHPMLLLYLQTINMLNTMDEIDFPENGFKKSLRTINRFAEINSEHLDELMPAALERAMHNYNVIQGSITLEVLEQPIGQLTTTIQ